MRSGWLKVGIPHVDVNRVARQSLLAPQFPRRKPYRVNALRILSLIMRVRIRKYIHAVVTINRADLPASVSRQSSVFRRVDIARPHALPGLKPLGRGHIAN